MKRKISKILIWVILLLQIGGNAVGVSAAGEAGADDELQEGSCGVSANWSYDEDTGILTISGSGGMYDYEAYDEDRVIRPWDDNWFGQVTEVIIRDGITYIGKNAFESCEAYAVKIADSVVSIGDGAFAGCAADDISLGNGVRHIGEGAFETSELTQIYMPASLERIGRRAFSDCEYLTTVFYQGSADDWGKINIESGNGALRDVRFAYGAQGIFSCTISFDTMGGSAVSPEVVGYGEALKRSIPAPSKEGCIFEHWSRDEAGEEIFDLNSEPVFGDITVYAVWRDASVYYMHMIVDGAEIDTIETRENDEFLYESIPRYEKSGFVLDGWYSDALCRDKKQVGEQEGFHVKRDEYFYGRWLDEKTPRHYRLAQSLESDSHIYTLAIEYDYSSELCYDGRKHVLYDGKSVSSDKINPDVYIRNFVVTLDDVSINGIGIKKAKFKNNINSSGFSKYDEREYMYIGLKLSYDIKKYPEYKRLYKSLKPVLKRMAMPRARRVEGSTWWDYDCAYITIKPFTVSENTPIYTRSQVDASPELQKEEGIFIWDGEVRVKWKKNYGGGGDTKAVGADIKGLCYQYGITLADGSRKIKQVRLKPGIRKYKVKGSDVHEDVFPYNADYALGYYTGYKKGDAYVSIYPEWGNFGGAFPSFPVSGQ